MPVTLIKLFRLGNASDPRMDHVREKDVEMFDIDGERWVRAGTGGISTHEYPGPIAGRWWCVDAGFDYGVLLLVWNDYDQHWSWEPAQDIRLADFKAALRATTPYFVRV